MIMLYRGLVGSVLEYGLVCYSGIARTHMLRLERVQYRGIRIALGLMCSTPNNSMAPLAEGFVYLNFIYLVAVFYRFDHPLKRRLETLREVNLGRCVAGYSDVLPLNIVSSGSFIRHNLPALLATYFVSERCIDGFLIDGCAGFAFHRAGKSGFATYKRGYSTPGKVHDFDGQLEFS
jgi:hypothetical protein